MAKYFVNPSTGKIEYFKYKIAEFKAKYGDLPYYADKKHLYKAQMKEHPEIDRKKAKESIYRSNKLYEPYKPVDRLGLWIRDIKRDQDFVKTLTKDDLVRIQTRLKAQREYEGQPAKEYLSNKDLKVLKAVQYQINLLLNKQPQRLNSRVRKYDSTTQKQVIGRFESGSGYPNGYDYTEVNK